MNKCGVTCIFSLLLKNCFDPTVVENSENSVIFRGFNASGSNFTLDNGDDDNVTLLTHCDPSENYTIIVHGYLESYSTLWVKDVIDNFLEARGGCVLFMDYSSYGTSLLYPLLVAKFDEITAILTQKLSNLEDNGFDPNNGFLFGFSFGAHVVLEGAYHFGEKKIGRIDVCEPTSMLFSSNSSSFVHANQSAKFVQCIHTDFKFGTSLRVCQKDINMGKCGKSQMAASIPPNGSHGLCPIFYNISFSYDFPIVPKEIIDETYNTTCVSKKFLPENEIDGVQLIMGYHLDERCDDGEYYADTSADFPYNQ